MQLATKRTPITTQFYGVNAPDRMSDMRQSLRFHFDAAKGQWIATENRKIQTDYRAPVDYQPTILWRPKFVVRPADALRERLGGRARPHAFVVPSQIRDGKRWVNYSLHDARRELMSQMATGAMRGYGVRYDARYDRGWCAAWHDRCELDSSTASNQPHHAYATLVSADWAMLWVANSKPVCVVYGPQWASIGSDYWRVSTKTVGALKPLSDPHDGEMYHSGADYSDVAVRHGLDSTAMRPNTDRRSAEDPLLDLLAIRKTRSRSDAIASRGSTNSIVNR